MTSSAPPPQLPQPQQAHGSKNTLALVSFDLSLVVPAVIIVALIAGIFSSGVSNFLYGNLQNLYLPLVIIDIVLGHLALAQVKRYPARQGGRGLAIAGLVLGYGEIVFFVLVALYILAHIQ